MVVFLPSVYCPRLEVLYDFFTPSKPTRGFFFFFNNLESFISMGVEEWPTGWLWALKIFLWPWYIISQVSEPQASQMPGLQTPA